MNLLGSGLRQMVGCSILTMFTNFAFPYNRGTRLAEELSASQGGMCSTELENIQSQSFAY